METQRRNHDDTPTHTKNARHHPPQRVEPLKPLGLQSEGGERREDRGHEGGEQGDAVLGEGVVNLVVMSCSWCGVQV